MRDQTLVEVLNRHRKPMQNQIVYPPPLSKVEKAFVVGLGIAMVLLLALAGGMLFGAGGC